MAVTYTPLNEAQLAVLAWIRDGCPEGVYPPEDPAHRSSALALANRKLIECSGRGKAWRATITEDGLYYLAHGDYPAVAGAVKPARRGKRDAGKPSEAVGDDPATVADERGNNGAKAVVADDPSAGRSAPPSRHAEKVPIPSEIRKPHPAVRELVKHPTRLEVPKEKRHRALLILHALVQEAVRRGWLVTANAPKREVDPWTGRGRNVFTGQDLFWIDAGDAPISIRLRMRRRRVEHVPTEEEQRESERVSWHTYPAYDYVDTDCMRIDIDGRYGKYSYGDGKSSRLEDKLATILERIEQESIQVREAEERRRREEEQRVEAARQAAELERRATHYGRWVDTLDHLRSDIIRHRELEDAVSCLREAVEQRGPEDAHAGVLGAYLDWAQTYLHEADPLRRIQLPPDDPPDMHYDEWSEWKRTHSERPRTSYGVWGKPY